MFCLPCYLRRRHDIDCWANKANRTTQSRPWCNRRISYRLGKTLATFFNVIDCFSSIVQSQLSDSLTCFISWRSHFHWESTIDIVSIALYTHCSPWTTIRVLHCFPRRRSRWFFSHSMSSHRLDWVHFLTSRVLVWERTSTSRTLPLFDWNYLPRSNTLKLSMVFIDVEVMSDSLSSAYSTLKRSRTEIAFTSSVWIAWWSRICLPACVSFCFVTNTPGGRTPIFIFLFNWFLVDRKACAGEQNELLMSKSIRAFDLNSVWQAMDFWRNADADRWDSYPTRSLQRSTLLKRWDFYRRLMSGFIMVDELF